MTEAPQVEMTGHISEMCVQFRNQNTVFVCLDGGGGANMKVLNVLSYVSNEICNANLVSDVSHILVSHPTIAPIFEPQPRQRSFGFEQPYTKYFQTGTYLV